MGLVKKTESCGIVEGSGLIMRGERSRLWIWGLAVFFLVTLLLWVIFRPQVVEAETVRVVRRDFVEILRSEGILRSRKRFSVTAFADGDMKRMDFRVGDVVKRGQILTSILWDLRYEPLRSPIQGVVSRVFRESAGPVRRGEAILEVVDPQDLEAVLELLTPDAARVKVGMPVVIDSVMLEKKFRGVVSDVSRAGFIKTSALGVEEERTEVRIRLLDAIPSQAGGNDFHLEATIEVSYHPGVLVIPIGAVFREGPRWAVYRYEAGVARKTVFEPGIRNEGWQVVLRGLQPNEEILNFPGDRVKDGVRIRRIRVEEP